VTELTAQMLTMGCNYYVFSSLSYVPYILNYHNYRLHRIAIMGNGVLQLVAICVSPVKIIVMTPLCFG